MENLVNSFNKKLFSELLLRIKGTRTLTKFAEETCTSIAHLSRMINEKLDSAPSPETLKKLLSKNQGDVTYEELMIAAGYINEKTALKNFIDGDEADLLYTSNKTNKKEATSNNQGIFEQRKKFKSTCMSTLLFNLSFKGYSWVITSGKDITDPFVNSFTLELGTDSKEVWTFDLRYITSSFKNRLHSELHLKQYVQDNWGRLACKPIAAGAKYSLVMENEDLYNAYKFNIPINLNLTLSIILLDPEELKILKEEYLCYSHNADIDKMSLFSF